MAERILELARAGQDGDRRDLRRPPDPGDGRSPIPSGSSPQPAGTFAGLGLLRSGRRSPGRRPSGASRPGTPSRAARSSGYEIHHGLTGGDGSPPDPAGGWRGDRLRRGGRALLGDLPPRDLRRRRLPPLVHRPPPGAAGPRPARPDRGRLRPGAGLRPPGRCGAKELEDGRDLQNHGVMKMMNPYFDPIVTPVKAGAAP